MFTRLLKIVGATLYVLFVAFAIIAALSEVWVFETWGSLAIDEVIYHLNVSLAGTNPDMVFDYLRTYGVVELFVIGVVCLLIWAVRKSGRMRRCALVSVALCSAALLALAAHDLDSRLGIVSYLGGNAGHGVSPDADEADTVEQEFIEALYVDPRTREIVFPERRRNLVYLFLESMETTYADVAFGGAFEQNYIPELTSLAQSGEDFSGDASLLNGGISLPGSTWTAGAMFAQASGLPLKVPVSGNFMEGSHDFFPRFRLIGDILADEGYRQVLLIGSQAGFAGRDALYSTHGGYGLHDYDYARAMGWIPEDYKEWWGYEDEKLFAFAREELLTLAASDVPFNLTMLTADTHFENGYVCDLCEDDFGGDQYANVIACSSRQVADFVTWMQGQDFWEDTTVIICGDHPTMDSDFCQGIPGDYQRKTYTLILNAAATPGEPSRRRSYSTMDLFPTTLAALGAHVEGDRLGLGTDLFSDTDTLIEEMGLKALTDGLNGHSTFLSSYVGPAAYETALESLAESSALDASAALADTTLLTLSGIDEMEREYLLDVRVELRHAMTARTTRYHMAIVGSGEDGSSFTCVARVPLSTDELSDYHAVARLWVRGIDQYPVASYGMEAPPSQKHANEGLVVDAFALGARGTTFARGEACSALELASRRAASKMRRAERAIRLTMSAVATVYNGRDS